MSVTTARYRETVEERFRRLLGAWLATLPPDGWTGGVVELFQVGAGGTGCIRERGEVLRLRAVE